MKETFYFSHDYNAFFDPKIRAVISEFGFWTYALFWVIIEMMASEKGYKLRKKYLAKILHPIIQGKEVIYKSEGGIGFFEDAEGNTVDDQDVGSFSFSLTKVQAVLDQMVEVALFECDDDFIWSNSLIERMKKRQEESEKKREAGRIGGLASAKKRKVNDRSSRPDTVVNILKERKVKENKVNSFKENIKENIFDSHPEEKFSGENLEPSKSTPSENADLFFETVQKKNDQYFLFIQKVSQTKNFPPEMVRAEVDKFCNYWREKTRDGKKERWQTEKVFEVQRRLTTWLSNSNKFSGFSKGSGPKPITII